MSKPSETDWDRITAMKDEMIDTSDIPPLADSFFEKSALRKPTEPVAVTVHLDPDVLAWFQAQGAQCEQRIGAAANLCGSSQELAMPRWLRRGERAFDPTAS